jgi:hypothetical protein
MKEDYLFDPSPRKTRRDLITAALLFLCGMIALALHTVLGPVLGIGSMLICVFIAYTFFAIAQTRKIGPIEPRLLPQMRVAPYIYLALAVQKLWRKIRQ